MSEIDNIIQQAEKIQQELGAKDFDEAIEILKKALEGEETSPTFQAGVQNGRIERKESIIVL